MDADAPDMPPAGVAVTVIVDVVVFVVVVVEPPQAENRLNPANKPTSSRNRRNRLRFLKPRKKSATARVAGKNGLTLWRSSDADAGRVTVSVVPALVPPGIPVVGFGVKATVELGLNVQP